MRKLLLTSFSILALCSSVYAQEIKPVGYDEASFFERALLARDRPSIEIPKKIFTQPINKKESCKLPTTSDQLGRSNFRAYWDGDCKNGYAFGLGRDIAISDTHHMEEIVIHNGTGLWYKGMPAVTYDFVNNSVRYWVVGEKFPELSGLSESMSNSISGFSVNYRAAKVYPDGSMSTVDFSPFSPWRFYQEVDQRIVYRFSDHALAPFVDYSQNTFVMEVVDPKDGKVGGVAIVRFGKDKVQHFQIEGDNKKIVTASEEYVSHLQGKYRNLLDVVRSINVEEARKIEREYLYFACNGKHRIDKLGRDVSSKSCNWRDRFKEPYEKSLAKYNQEVEQIKLKAESALRNAEAQRISDQQRDAQQRQLEAQREIQSREQTQQGLQGVVNLLSQMGQGMQESSRQFIQPIQIPTPQATPFPSIGRNRTSCVTVGLVTNCR